jgi:flagellin
MGIGVLFNIPAIQNANLVDRVSSRLQHTLQQLASGSRINSAADDAAGLALANGMNANIAALGQSVTNTDSSISRLQVADGALSQVTSMLNRAVNLATESANGTMNLNQRSAADNEYQTILAEITNIGQTTTYNQQQIFGGSTSDSFTGDSSILGSMIDQIDIKQLSSGSVGDTGGTLALVAATGTTPATITYAPGSGIDLSTSSLRTASGATSALSLINQSISTVSIQDGYVGSQINTLNSVKNVLQTQQTNTLSALNSIEAVDYAQATSDLSREQVLMQTSVAALAQATRMNHDIVKLIQ